MNTAEIKIMNTLVQHSFTNQRELAAASGCSLGMVNRSLKNLIRSGYLTQDISLTETAEAAFQAGTAKNAIILAAGFGMRMVPINMETPKAFLEVHGQRLIERLIRQLHEAGIREIYVVVGFMKEQFEYLIDDFGVKLIVNPDYASKNNLHSLALALEYLDNSYIVPCDIWCRNNPFRCRDLRSWYMVSDSTKQHSQLRVTRTMELQRTASDGNTMVGISYLLREDSGVLAQRIRRMDGDERYRNSFWEEALFEKDRMMVDAEVVPSQDVVEINSYEQLRDLDSGSAQLQSRPLEIAAQSLHVQSSEICNITVLKKGMTNRSFLFQCRGKKYIMRIPGEGTDHMINRREEAAVYATIRDRRICDDILCIDPETGYKITAYLENAHSCDPQNPEDVRKCMDRLRKFHNLRLKVDHSFDIFGKIEFYESLWNGAPSVYRDYQQTKQQVFSLRPYLEAHATEKVLTHIDAVPDNFLFFTNDNGQEEIRLIDWEYAGMQDPHVDLAMFCIYALYDRSHVDALIDSYFTEGCDRETRRKIYGYIAACGLLWSNWCEYKRSLGVEFGEYSLRQYRYAKEYYRIFQEEN